jgi:anti-sigma-K factor RskA
MPHPENTPSVPAPKGVSPWWRALSIFLAVLLTIGVASGMSLFEQFKAQMQHMQTQLSSVPHIKYISVLTDAQKAPAMLITLDPQDNTLQLQRLNKVAEGQEDSMQLWALSGSERPRSFGVLTARLPMQRLNAGDADLAHAQELAISVEAKGGVSPQQGPRLPYLFSGAVIQKAQ